MFVFKKNLTVTVTQYVFIDPQLVSNRLLILLIKDKNILITLSKLMLLKNYFMVKLK